MKDLVYLPDVVTLNLCQDTCNGCGMCIQVCPHEVFELSGKKLTLSEEIIAWNAGPAH